MKRLLALGDVGNPSRNLVCISSMVPPLYNKVILRHHSTEKDEGTLSEIGEKARSTAEEFLRVAKEKSDEISESAQETMHETKEAVLGESEDDKEKFKERVEKGKYHHQN